MLEEEKAVLGQSWPLGPLENESLTMGLDINWVQATRQSVFCSVLNITGVSGLVDFGTLPRAVIFFLNKCQ